MSETRRRLADELGARPSAVLNDAFQLLLRYSAGQVTRDSAPQSPHLASPPAPVPTCLLPVPGQRFVGRTDELAALACLLTSPVLDPRSIGPRKAMITGAIGVGKSALALEVAWAVSEMFPDGQFYLDLAGHPGGEAGSLSLLRHCLQVLEVPEDEIEADGQSRRRLMQTLTKGKSILWVVDNATPLHLVEPILPLSAAGGIVVTGRSPHPDLMGAERWHLQPMSTSDSWNLVASVAGESRLSRDPEATDALLRLCEGLPAALLMAARQLVAFPHRGMADVVLRLGDEERRLREFSWGSHGLRAALNQAFTAISGPVRDAFAGLGLIGVDECEPWMVAAVSDCPDSTAVQLLEDLVEDGLVECIRAPDSGELRYRCGGLSRQFALHAWHSARTDLDTEAALNRLRHRSCADSHAEVVVQGHFPPLRHIGS